MMERTLTKLPAGMSGRIVSSIIVPFIIACASEKPSSPDVPNIVDVGSDFDASIMSTGGFKRPNPILPGFLFEPTKKDIGVQDAGFDLDSTMMDVEETPMRHRFDHVLSIEHIQMRGSHNSYHVEPRIVLHGSHRYSHLSLDRQLEEQGVRVFELDVHKQIGGTALSVYHIAVVDDVTTCSSFVDCISTVKSWSDANPEHVPISIWIEPKDEAGGGIFTNLDQVDLDVRSVFPASQLITPDDVIGTHASIRAALDTVGWPKLDQSRGRVMFLLLETGGLRDGYMRDSGDLSGRVMFPNASPTEFTEAWASVSKINNPMDLTDIAAARASHILVASNLCAADLDDSDCVAKRSAGLGNGVHMLKDDFPGMVASRNYWLEIPTGNPVRCNPHTAPPECTSLALEDLP